MKELFGGAGGSANCRPRVGWGMGNGSLELRTGIESTAPIRDRKRMMVRREAGIVSRDKATVFSSVEEICMKEFDLTILKD